MRHAWIARLIQRLWPRDVPTHSTTKQADCPHCAATIHVSDRFCTQCGTLISSASAHHEQWQTAGDQASPV